MNCQQIDKTLEAMFRAEYLQFDRLCQQSDKALEAMFGAENWQFERLISKSDVGAKREIIILQSEVDKHILPGLKRQDVKDLRDGKAINILVYDEDTKDRYKLKLLFERPYYRLRDATELYEKKSITAGQRIGFRYEAHFATLVIKFLK